MNKTGEEDAVLNQSKKLFLEQAFGCSEVNKTITKSILQFDKAPISVRY